MIRGNVRECAPTRIESTMNANIHNRFDIEVRDAKTNQLKQKAQAFNVICNNFWKYMASYFKDIAYGDGLGTPSSNDTTLFGNKKLASLTAHTCGYDIKTGVAYETRKAILDERTSVGMTITEVGLQNAKGYLVTHAMIQDMNGNPISITKTDTDIVTIYATVYVHWTPCEQNGITLCPPRGSVGNFVSYGYAETITMPNVFFGSGTFGTRAEIGVGSVSWNDITKTLTYNAPRASVSVANISGGFGFIIIGGGLANDYLCAVVDVRGKYEVTGEAVGTGDGSTKTFATKFDLPENTVVYVDGMPMTSGVTVYPHPVNSDAGLYMMAMRDTLYAGKPCFTCVTNILPNTSAYLYNPLNELGIGSIPSNGYRSYIKFAFSDDFVNWSDEYSQDSSVSVEHRHCKYIRIRNTYTSSITLKSIPIEFPSNIRHNNIVFDEPPAKGSVITIDYITPFVPKDENHVYDFSMTVQYGEYTEI